MSGNLRKRTSMEAEGQRKRWARARIIFAQLTENVHCWTSSSLHVVLVTDSRVHMRCGHDFFYQSSPSQETGDPKVSLTASHRGNPKEDRWIHVVKISKKTFRTLDDKKRLLQLRRRSCICLTFCRRSQALAELVDLPVDEFRSLSRHGFVYKIRKRS